jgi:hypothetical protein
MFFGALHEVGAMHIYIKEKDGQTVRANIQSQILENSVNYKYCGGAFL